MILNRDSLTVCVPRRERRPYGRQSPKGAGGRDGIKPIWRNWLKRSVLLFRAAIGRGSSPLRPSPPAWRLGATGGRVEAVLGGLIPNCLLVFPIMSGVDGKYFAQMPDIIQQCHLDTLILSVLSTKTDTWGKRFFNGSSFKIFLDCIVDIIKISKDLILCELRYLSHFLLSVSGKHTPPI